MARTAFCLATAILAIAARAPAGPLHIGDLAPKIDVREFIKGKPVDHYVHGKTYVIDFWKAASGLSRARVPLINELQQKYKDVVFIGISVDESRLYSEVKAHVESMGAKMSYRVAVDRPLRRDWRGAMEDRWLSGTISPDVPSAFIIDRSGRIAWIGDPAQMAMPLERVTAGKWDLAAAARRFEKKQRDQALVFAANEKLHGPEILRRWSKSMNKALSPDEIARSLDGLSAFVDSNRFSEEMKQTMKQTILGQDRSMNIFGFALTFADQNTQDRAYQEGCEAVRKTWKDDIGQLSLFAWYIVAPGAEWKPQKRFLELALEAARRADALTEGKHADSADTLARAYFVNGEPAKALAAQGRALQLAKSTVLEHFKPYREHLETYRKAVAATKK